MAAPHVSLTPDNLRVHVIHYTPLIERRVHMERELSVREVNHFPLRWVTEHDREQIEARHASGEFGNPQAFGASFVSVILKHLDVFQNAAASDIPWHLALEDDVFIDPEWRPKLERLLTELPEDWEIVFVGDGCKLHIPFWMRHRGKSVHFRGHHATWWGGGGISRCAAGYLIRPESARRFLTSIHTAPPFSAPIDWLMNRAGADLKIRSHWAEPPLIRQGAFESWTKDRRLNPDGT